MKVSWNKKLNELCEEYTEKEIKNKLNRVRIRRNIKELIESFLRQIEEHSAENKFIENLRSFVEEYYVSNIAGLFKGELREFALFLLGEEWTELLDIYMHLESRSPYTRGYERRSQRSVNPFLHIDSELFMVLRSFFILRATGLSTEEILDIERIVGKPREYGCGVDIQYWLTAKIANGDVRCINYLKDAMMLENNTQWLGFEHFKAIAKSADKELLEMEGKLLLAARLQEGLRQAIIETIDEGAPESFKYILKIVLENNLQRYASIRRGIAVTTGLGEEAAPDRITDKFLNLIYTYISNIREAYKALESDDAMKVYLGLWAIGFYDVDELEDIVLPMISEAPSYKVCAAMLMVQATMSNRIYIRTSARAIKERIDDHRIVSSAISLYLSDGMFYVNLYGEPNKLPPLEWFFDSREEAEKDFENLSSLFSNMKSTEIFEPFVFPWLQSTLTKGIVAEKICKIALLLQDNGYIDRALHFLDAIPADDRAGYLKHLLKFPLSTEQLKFAVSAMTDRSRETSEAACRIVERLHEEKKLTAMDYLTLEEHLRLKSAKMRQTVIRILRSLPDFEALSAVNNLINDNNAERRLAGLDIIKNWTEEEGKENLVEWITPELGSIKNPSNKEKILIDSIIGNINDFSEATGDSGIEVTYSASELYVPGSSFKPEIKKCGEKNLWRYVTFEDKEEPLRLMKSLMSLIETNSDLEVRLPGGNIERIGNYVCINGLEKGLGALGYPEIWRGYYENEVRNPLNMLKLYYSLYRINENLDLFKKPIKKILGKQFITDDLGKLTESVYFRNAYDIVSKLFEEYCGVEEIWEVSVKVLSEYAANASEEDCVKEKTERYYTYPLTRIYEVFPINIFSRLLKDHWKKLPDNLFIRGFLARYELYRKGGYLPGGELKYLFPLDPNEFIRAWHLGVLSDSDIWREMMSRDDSDLLVRAFTKRFPGAENRYSYGKPEIVLEGDELMLVDKAIDRMLDTELKRGDTRTQYSHIVRSICAVRGMGYYIRILKALGNDRLYFDRYVYQYCSSSVRGFEKGNVLSYLLSVCYPDSDASPDKLREVAFENGIEEMRLVEAAMFSPRWLEITEDAIGWKGLTSAAYYFLAHTAEYLTETERSHIERYSSIAPQDFADGAFDNLWFKEIYESLGEKRFNAVYKAARFISQNNRHSRSRKLADAFLGKMRAEDVMTEINAKRNKDFVVALGLIPLGSDPIAEIRARYDFLNDFLKESKKFGSQRQASEKRAVTLALDNLARTAGFGDSTRLMWSMEADLVKEISEYLIPKELDDLRLNISIGEGVPAIIVEKDGKKLKSIPSRIKKESYFIELKNVVGRLKDQHVRGRTLLEQAMTENSEFTSEEIAGLSENPVIWSMLSNLVLVKDENIFGFMDSDGRSIVTQDGEIIGLADNDKLRIAHPYDLYKAGVWGSFQRIIFDKKICQPFRQVFRELYIATDEEKPSSVSLRYSGNQIMPGRASALLKKRGWTVDYENGLEKVSYHGDVIAVLYAMADWFSPSDIEAPTLEYVSFYNRRDFNEKKISEIDPIVFSEIMRDVDLAVSVAHVGGVDPETSHSTIEMRTAIVEHSLPLLGIKNVSISGNFVKVAGKLGNYNVHLGSGVIHIEGGKNIAVIPVHSQSRGKIFMPFLDEDPKTAEIITKIMMFSHDDKIKDPTILSQIKN